MEFYWNEEVNEKRKCMVDEDEENLNNESYPLTNAVDLPGEIARRRTSAATSTYSHL